MLRKARIGLYFIVVTPIGVPKLESLGSFAVSGVWE